MRTLLLELCEHGRGNPQDARLGIKVYRRTPVSKPQQLQPIIRIGIGFEIRRKRNSQDQPLFRGLHVLYKNLVASRDGVHVEVVRDSPSRAPMDVLELRFFLELIRLQWGNVCVFEFDLRAGGQFACKQTTGRSHARFLHLSAGRL